MKSQHKLFYCWKTHVAGTKPAYLFGGIYSDNGEKKIPITTRPRSARRERRSIDAAIDPLLDEDAELGL